MGNQEIKKVESSVNQREQSEEKGVDVVIDELIDLHATIIIDGHRYDGIIEEKRNESSGNVLYKVKFDSSNSRESEWVKPNQIETQQIVTCDNFQTGDNVQVGENGSWFQDAVAKVGQIYEGATGAKIYQVSFPELGDYYMYKNENDIRKYTIV